ncbi:MAG: hypothetical protein KKF67_02625, partial [Nanoarchaeota archaeon]|nr:hypothetical protein [Nanoarchaeota archaeon]
MAKNSNDKAYERGVKAGKEGCILDDLANSLGKSLSISKADEIYDKGYKWGAEHRGDSSSDNSSGGSSSICYLTTACVDSMGLNDNCLELNVLRKFRDNVLLPSISQVVKEYYAMAPDIISAINDKDNSKEIWENVYKDITRAVSLVFRGDFNRAFNHYQQMTLGLKENYLK